MTPTRMAFTLYQAGGAVNAHTTKIHNKGEVSALKEKINNAKTAPISKNHAAKIEIRTIRRLCFITDNTRASHAHTRLTLSHALHTLTRASHSHTRFTLSHAFHTLTRASHSHAPLCTAYYARRSPLLMLNATHRHALSRSSCRHALFSAPLFSLLCSARHASLRSALLAVMLRCAHLAALLCTAYARRSRLLMLNAMLWAYSPPCAGISFLSSGESFMLWRLLFFRDERRGRNLAHKGGGEERRWRSFRGEELGAQKIV